MEDEAQEDCSQVQFFQSTASIGQRRLKREAITQKNIANLKKGVVPKQNIVIDPVQSIHLAEEIVIDQLRRANKIAETDISILKLYRSLERNRPLIENGWLVPPVLGFFEALAWEMHVAIITGFIALYTEEQRASYQRARIVIENEFVKYSCRGLNPDGRPGGDIGISRMANVCISGIPVLKNSGISFINGVANEFIDAEKNALNLSEYAQAEIKLVYSATHGVVQDGLEAAMRKASDGGRLDINERLLLLQWEEFFATHGPDAKFHQICHSKGAIHVKNALRAAPQSIRDKIVVTAIAPASIIVPGECLEVNNYASEKDVWLLKMHRELSPGNLKHVKILKADEMAGGNDHSFDSPTYQEEIKRAIELFDETYGASE